ncbi:MAG TPA: hypothetical protein VI386_20680 [Candidatus Sulfotelmatobacter sp.]
MKRIMGLMLGTCLLSGYAVVVAQGQSEGAKPDMSPPKVLTITREWTKPGKSGMTHEKAESAFVQAMSRAKWPTHYLDVDSLTGKPRSLFLTGYDSFEAWEKDMRATQKNASLSGALDHAAVVDGDLLAAMDQAALMLRPELSLRTDIDIPHMRYFEISRFHIKAGHDHDWEELAKLYQKGCDKVPECHWAAYQVIYGLEDNTYILFNPMKSAAEIDHNFTQMKQFSDTLGEKGMERLAELSGAAIESSETNLFVFNPRMSYPSDEWIKADPEFWKPKAAMAESKKPASKTSEKPSGQ